MKQKPRIYYSDSQKALTWERWRKGDSPQQIAQLFDRNHSSVQRILAETGGISPVPRCCSTRALTLAEREEISRGLVAGRSIRALVTQLRRGPFTVSSEVKRNGSRECYRAHQADQATWARARRPKPYKLAEHPALTHIVANKLQSLWSPEQIAGWLKRTYPENASHQVSQETIYRTLYIQTRAALKKELLAYLRRMRIMRRSHHHTQKTGDHGRIVDAVSISERPATAYDRAVPGHWEGDLLCGSNSSQIATLVERQSRYLMLVKLSDKDTGTVANALIKNARKLPQELYKSLTWDRGKEMAGHKRFTLAERVQNFV